jgi:dephospho-CoA kinase
VVREFGSGILGESGEINRRRLAAAVFDNPGRLALLNSLVHPHVIQLEERRMAEIEAAEPRAITVVEAAILIETGSYRRFDRLILAVCGEADQIARGMRRDGISEQEARARIARQMPLEDKRRYANFIVDTSGTREDTLEQTRRVFGALQAIAQAVPPRQNE